MNTFEFIDRILNLLLRLACSTIILDKLNNLIPSNDLEEHVDNAVQH